MTVLSEKPVVYVVATPIGNLEDISLRALKILKEVDLIAAEDTRHTRKLLNFFEITGKRIISYYDQKEMEKSKVLLAKIVEEGLSLALVSDAGTPCISDPGFRLIQEARRLKIPVHPIPGPSSILALASSSGLPTDRFMFVGFLPVKEKALINEIQSWKQFDGSIIFFDSTRRLTKTFKQIFEQFPEAMISIGRELTKLYEEIVTLPIKEAIYWLETHENLRGEAVVMIAPGLPKEAVGNQISEEDLIKEAKRRFKQGDSLKDLLRLYQNKGYSRGAIYQLLLKAKEESEDL